jgi:Uma2 family endonuclease
MTLATEPHALPKGGLEQVQHLVLNNVSWDLYESLLEAVGDGTLRLTYDKGDLEIMSPLPIHERVKKVLGGMIEIIALELNVPMRRLGSTTFRRKKLQQGAEPDECYYIQNEPRVRGKMDLDLRRDPAPDLVVEVDITSRTIKKEPIYAAMGVLEVWRYDGEKHQSLWLQKNGRYASKKTSRAFPWLKMAEVERFLRMLPGRDETSVLRAWREQVCRTGPAGQ